MSRKKLKRKNEERKWFENLHCWRRRLRDFSDSFVVFANRVGTENFGFYIQKKKKKYIYIYIQREKEKIK